MLGSAFEDSVSRDLVIQNHGTPTGRFTLRADKGAEFHLAALLQDFKKDLYFPFVSKSMEQEIVQNEQVKAAGILQAFLVLGVVGTFEDNQLFQKLLTMVVC